VAHFGFAIGGVVLFSPLGWPAEGTTEATITVVDESGTPVDVTRALPDAALDAGESSALDRAQDGAKDMRRLRIEPGSEPAFDAGVDAAGNADIHRP
jgi:hypothetical protein